MPPEDNPADERTELGLCIQEIHELQQKMKVLQIDLDIANEFRRDAIEALELFRQFDGDEDLWAAMKRDREELRRLLFAVLNGDTLPDMTRRVHRALDGFNP